MPAGMICQRLDMEVHYVSQRDKVKSTFPPGLVCERIELLLAVSNIPSK